MSQFQIMYSLIGLGIWMYSDKHKKDFGAKWEQFLAPIFFGAFWPVLLGYHIGSWCDTFKESK